jgi:hypothetical protein
MSNQHARLFSRRGFLRGMTLAGSAGLLGLHARRVAAEPPPETTRLRLYKTPGICIAPQYVAEKLLHLEGFTEVHYVAADPAKMTLSTYQQCTAGGIDLSTTFAPPSIIQVDAGAPIVLLGGVHVGCYEVFGTDRVRAIRDLKGKTVAVPELGGLPWGVLTFGLSGLLEHRGVLSTGEMILRSTPICVRGYAPSKKSRSCMRSLFPELSTNYSRCMLIRRSSATVRLNLCIPPIEAAKSGSSSATRTIGTKG